MNIYIYNDNELIRKVKELIVDTAMKCSSNHIPSSLSSLEILYTLYTKVANINSSNASELIRDRVILSKEHAKLGQVCLLSVLGLLPSDIVNEWQQNNGRIGHDLFNVVGCPELSALDISCSSLGQGLGLGIGYAIAAPNNNIYVVVGDGELQEGSNWEALLFIEQHNIKNLCMVIDRNYIQISDYTKNIIDTSTINKKMESFNFNVIECDGHNINELEKVLKIKSDRPKCIIANTKKGKECEFLLQKNGPNYIHGYVFTEEEHLKIKENIK